MFDFILDIIHSTEEQENLKRKIGERIRTIYEHRDKEWINRIIGYLNEMQFSKLESLEFNGYKAVFKSEKILFGGIPFDMSITAYFNKDWMFGDVIFETEYDTSNLITDRQLKEKWITDKVFAEVKKQFSGHMELLRSYFNEWRILLKEVGWDGFKHEEITNYHNWENEFDNLSLIHIRDLDNGTKIYAYMGVMDNRFTALTDGTIIRDLYVNINASIDTDGNPFYIDVSTSSFIDNLPIEGRKCIFTSLKQGMEIKSENSPGENDV